MSVYSRARGCQLPNILAIPFPILNGFVMLSWLVPCGQAPRSTCHGICKELEAVRSGLGLGIQLDYHWQVDGEVTGRDTLQVLACTWHDGSCFLGSCWSPAFAQCQRPGTRTRTGPRTSEQDTQVGMRENRALASTGTSSRKVCEINGSFSPDLTTSSKALHIAC